MPLYTNPTAHSIPKIVANIYSNIKLDARVIRTSDKPANLLYTYK